MMLSKLLKDVIDSSDESVGLIHGAVLVITMYEPLPSMRASALITVVRLMTFNANEKKRMWWQECNLCFYLNF